MTFALKLPLLSRKTIVLPVFALVAFDVTVNVPLDAEPLIPDPEVAPAVNLPSNSDCKLSILVFTPLH